MDGVTKMKRINVMGIKNRHAMVRECCEWRMTVVEASALGGEGGRGGGRVHIKIKPVHVYFFIIIIIIITRRNY